MANETQVDLNMIRKAKSYLADNAAAVNPVLKEFFDYKRRTWAPRGAIVSQSADVYDAMTCNGKKVRASLVILGYDACKMEKSPVSTVPDGLYRAAGSVEILHNAFLIHDDIVDHSDMRRNVPTVHRRIADDSRARFATAEEALSYGAAVALNYGDKGQALAQELLLSSGFPEGVLLRAVQQLSEVTVETVTGQLLDVEYITISDLSEDLVMKIHEFKTANYTVMLPLLMGAILAGSSQEVLASIRRFAIPIGIAFQIQDDILGLYGEESVLGKPVDSDVKEGKKTLLFVHAYEAAGPQERRFLEQVHGNPDLQPGNLEKVRKIVEETGALAKSEQYARELVEQGKPCINGIAGTEEWRNVLGGLAEYFISRRH